jgi:predicted DNA-binding protein with PD1-like motif
VTLGDDSYRAIAGHLNEATAGATTEITITPLAAPVFREFSPDVGMQLIVVDAHD